MSRAFLCDKCHAYMEKVFVPEEVTLDKHNDLSVIGNLQIVCPQGFDLCQKCWATYVTNTLNRIIEKAGGVATVTWDKPKGGETVTEDTKQAATKPLSKNFKQTQTKGETKK